MATSHPHCRIETGGRGVAQLTICNVNHLPQARSSGLDTLRVPDLVANREVGVLMRGGAWRSPLAERLTQLLKVKVQAMKVQQARKRPA